MIFWGKFRAIIGQTKSGQKNKAGSLDWGRRAWGGSAVRAAATGERKSMKEKRILEKDEFRQALIIKLTNQRDCNQEWQIGFGHSFGL